MRIPTPDGFIDTDNENDFRKIYINDMTIDEVL